MFYSHTKLFDANSELAAPCTFLSSRGSIFNIAARISRSMSILFWYLDLITATDKKPASHKYDVANGIRIQRALQLTSVNSNRAVIQKEVIKSRL